MIYFHIILVFVFVTIVDVGPVVHDVIVRDELRIVIQVKDVNRLVGLQRVPVLKEIGDVVRAVSDVARVCHAVCDLVSLGLQIYVWSVR